MNKELIEWQCETRLLVEKHYINNAKTPEERLWISVLLVFLLDTQKAYFDYSKSTNGRLELIELKIQHLKFASNDPHAEDICDYAGFSYEVFKKIIVDILEGKKTIPISSNYGKS